MRMYGKSQHKAQDERALVGLTHVRRTDRGGKEGEEEAEDDMGETVKQFKALGSSMPCGSCSFHR